VSSEILNLGYEAALRAISQQDATLANFRNRAMTLLSATTVVTTLATSVGLLNINPSRGSPIPVWAAVALLSAAVLIGVCSLYIIWPVAKWSYGTNPAAYVHNHQKGRDEDDFKIRVIESLDGASRENRSALQRRSWALRAAVALLIVELGMIVVTALLYVR
jgi:hypothetical protein